MSTLFVLWVLIPHTEVREHHKRTTPESIHFSTSLTSGMKTKAVGEYFGSH